MELPQSTRTAEEAATAIGCHITQIAKSLIFKALDTGQPVLVIASGPNRVDEKMLEDYLKAPVAMADADFVRLHTGYAIGGVPPFGHTTPAETIIDRDLLQFDEIWAAAGTPRSVFSISPQKLAAVTGGKVYPVNK